MATGLVLPGAVLMPNLTFGTSSYERARGDMPSLPVINMFVEESPTEETQIAMQSRPALVDRGVTMGSGPVREVFRADSVLGTDLFGVSGSNLYRNATSIGSIDGSGPVSIAGYENFLFTAAGGSLLGYNGATLVSIPFPDGASVAKVIVGASRAIAIRKDTGKFYWSEPLGTSITALNFATAESAPDRALDLLFIDNILIIFGAETVEFWPATTSSDAPFTPLQGRVIERGIKATGCATQIGSAYAWVSNHNQICLNDENTVISNPGLEERIAASTECRLFRFFIYGAEFLALRIDGETQVWRNGKWSEFQSYGFANWVPQCWSDGVFGSAYDGRTMAWGSGHADLGGVLERRFRAGMPINSGGVTISNLQIRCNIGQTPYLTGDYANPKIEMRTSRNAGKTWGPYKQKTLGEQGQYRTKVQWRALGMASYPAFFAEFRCVDPVDFRVSQVTVNDVDGGR